MKYYSKVLFTLWYAIIPQLCVVTVVAPVWRIHAFTHSLPHSHSLIIIPFLTVLMLQSSVVKKLRYNLWLSINNIIYKIYT